MAVNRNFVVKNGLEVNQDLILADAFTNRVGIGSTIPQFELDVLGGIGASFAYVSTAATIAVGVVTNVQGTNLNYSGIGTIANLGGSNISYSGVGTINTLYGDGAEFNTIYADVGIVTFTNTTGVSTVGTEFNVGVGGTVLTALVNTGVGSVGIATANPEYLLDVRSPVSTGVTALYVQGDVRITGDINVDDITFDDATVQNLTVTDTLYVGGESGLSTFVGRSDFQDYVDFQSGLIISGITTIVNTTDSTTYNNGALVIDGGLGVEKSVNIGGNLDVTGNISVAGSFFSLQSQEVYISNKDIVLGFTTTITPNDDTANHAGVAIASTEGYPLVSFSASGINTLPDTYKQMMWFRSGTLGFSTDIFGLNYGLAIGTTTVANGVRLAVGSDITFTDTDINAINGNFSSVVSGIVTATSLTSTDVNVTGIITTVSLNTTDINVTGVATINNVSIAGAALSSLYVSGISTLGTVQVASGIVTATSGIVTYYGDGSNLTGTASGLTAAIGVGSESTFVGAGVTEIYFATTTGTNVNVVAAGTSATVTITPGVSLGLAIALGG